MRPEDVARVVTLYEENYSIRHIASVVNIPRSTVADAIRRYRETGLYLRKPGSGRPRATSYREDRFIVTSVLRDRALPATIVAQDLLNATGTVISAKTVRRRIKEQGLTSHRPAHGPLLLAAHRTARLQFARSYMNWTNEEWSNVLFSDESRFCLRSPDGRERVWRRPNERFAPCCISPKQPFGGGSVMVWAGISRDAKTDLVLIENGAMTASRYIQECLADHVVPFAPFVGQNFIYMQDNAPPHVARIVSEYLDEVEIRRLPWPARSPDLNPIEHVWDLLGRRVRQHQPPPQTLQELRRVLLEEWDNMPQEKISMLIISMPRRLRAVLNARGGNTRY